MQFGNFYKIRKKKHSSKSTLYLVVFLYVNALTFFISNISVVIWLSFWTIWICPIRSTLKQRLQFSSTKFHLVCLSYCLFSLWGLYLCSYLWIRRNNLSRNVRILIRGSMGSWNLYLSLGISSFQVLFQYLFDGF